MRTATLRFEFEQLHITKGIRVSRKDDLEKIHIFAAQERVLTLPITIDDPPLIIQANDDSGVREYYLSRLSLGSDLHRGFHASREVDDREKVLLYIDTRDDAAPRRNIGDYTLPKCHDMRLPSSRTSAQLGSAKYGLIVCAPLENIVVRSTSGHAIKIMLGADGTFSRVAYDARRIVFPN